MAGAQRGAVNKFKETTGNERAEYFPCASHELNLVLSKSCNVKKIRNIVDTLQSVVSFFLILTERQRAIDKTVEEHNLGTEEKIAKSKVKPLSRQDGLKEVRHLKTWTFFTKWW